MGQHPWFPQLLAYSYKIETNTVKLKNPYPQTPKTSIILFAKFCLRTIII